MTRAELARRLQAIRDEVRELRRWAPSPALEIMLITVMEELFIAQEYADPTSVVEFTPYDEDLGFQAQEQTAFSPMQAGQEAATTWQTGQ